MNPGDDFNRLVLEFTTYVQRLPAEDRVVGCSVVFLVICSNLLEDATLHGRLEAERGDVLDVIDRLKDYIKNWEPMTPADADLLDAMLKEQRNRWQGGGQ